MLWDCNLTWGLVQGHRPWLPAARSVLPTRAAILPPAGCAVLSAGNELLVPVFEKLRVKLGRQTSKNKSVLLGYFVSSNFLGRFLSLYAANAAFPSPPMLLCSQHKITSAAG